MTSRRTYANTRLPGLLLPVPLSSQQATAGTHSTKILRHSQAGLAQCSLRSELFSPGLWCIRSFVCVLQESLFPLILGKFRNQTPLAFRVRFPGDFRSLCRIPRLGSLMWGLTWENECAVYGNSLYYLCNFSMNIKLF